MRLFSKEVTAELIALYLLGESPADLAKRYPYKRTAIKEMLYRRGVLRTQSAASSMAIKQGKKEKFRQSCQPRKLGTYYQRNKEKVDQKQKASSLKRRYGLTVDDIENMVLEQEGCCAICQRCVKLGVDHHHDSGKVRGLLCNHCNSYLGVIGESVGTLQRAIDYLRST
jgi:hypothetical protein